MTRIQLSIFAIVTVLSVGAIAVFYLHVPGAARHRHLQRHCQFRRRRRSVRERQRHLPRRDSRAGRAVALDRRRRRRADAAQQRRPDSRRTSPPRSRASPRSANSTWTSFRRRSVADDCSQTGHASQRPDRDPPGHRRAAAQADRLVSSVGNTRIQDLLRETFKAFNGSGPELARLIQSARLLVDEANTNWPQTTPLIDQAGPFLEAQIRSGDDIRSLADGLARFTSEVHKRIRSFGRCCRPPRARRRKPTTPSLAFVRHSRCWRPTWPTSVASASSTASRSNRRWSSSLPCMPRWSPSAAASPPTRVASWTSRSRLNDPPPCNTGFLPPPVIRSPA